MGVVHTVVGVHMVKVVGGAVKSSKYFWQLKYSFHLQLPLLYKNVLNMKKYVLTKMYFYESTKKLQKSTKMFWPKIMTYFFGIKM